MLRLAVALLALLTAPVAAAELDAPPAVLAAQSPLDCGVPHSLPINITCTQYAGGVCTMMAQPTCWTLRLVCTHAKGPIEYASGGDATCGQQPGCCDPCQGANCTNETRDETGSDWGCANFGIHVEFTLGDWDCYPGCENHGIHVDVAVGDRDCGNACTNRGIQIEARLGTTRCGGTCDNAGISIGVGWKDCHPSPVWVCTGAMCFWLAGMEAIHVAPTQEVDLVPGP